MKKVVINFFTFDKVPKLSHKITTNIVKGGDEDDDLFLLDLPTQIAKKTKETKLIIFPDDTIADLKEKIYVETNILPCEQHLGGISYRIKIDGALWKPNLEKPAKEYISGAPINWNIYNNRDKLDIISRDDTRLGCILPKLDWTINLLPLSEILKPENLDDHSIELLYWSLVIYYPYFNFESFKLYCVDRTEFAAQYPAFIPNVADKIAVQNAVLEKIYDTYKNPPKNFLKYYPQFIEGKENKSSIVSVSIRNCSILIEKRESIEIKNIFYKISTTADLPIIKLVHQTHELYKITHGNQNIYNKFKSLFHDNYNSITLLIKIDSTHYCALEYRSNGKVVAHLTFYAEDESKFREIYGAIANYIMPVHNKVKKLGRLVFNDFTNIKNREINSINVQILIRRKISTNEFNQFINDMIKEYFAAPHSNIPNTVNWKKGINKGANIEEHTDVWNKFEYLTDPEFKELWNKWYPGPVITMVNRDIDIKFDIKNVNEFELYTIYRYITYKIWQIKGLKVMLENTDLSKLNKLKLLEAHDPNLFNMQIYDSKTVYSRVCQKQYQPIPVNKNQLPNLDPDSYIKFWNYTTESETYYHCPNSDYKHPYFMVGYHPLAYCLICCKKNKPKPGSKQANIRDKCIKHHRVIGEETKSTKTRYTINYGKHIEPGRLSMLPNLLEKFIVYNISNDELLSYISTIRLFKKGDKVYNIDRLIKIVGRSKIRKIETRKLELFLHIEIWSLKRRGVPELKPIDVINNPNKNRKYRRHMQRIMESGNHPILLYFDKSREGFIVLDGIHRLAKAYIKDIPYIEYKLVTDKQLKRSLIGKEENDLLHIDPPNVSIMVTKKTFTGGSEKEPQYFIYGVPQTYEGADIGVGYCLAATLNMPFKLFIKNTMSIVDPQTAALIEVFIESKPILSDVNWNELFIEIAVNYYNIIPIIIEDNTFYSAGVNVDVIESFNLIVPYGIKDLTKYPNKNFMVVIRKREKSGINENQLEYNHHPVFIIISYSFFKRDEIERRLYNIDDPIIKIVNKLLVKKKDEKSINFDKIKSAVSSIQRVFINNKNLAYAAEVKFNNKLVYIGFIDEYIDNDKYKTAKYATDPRKYDSASLIKLLKKLHGDNIKYKVINHYGILHNNIVHYCNIDTNRRADICLNYAPQKILKTIEKELTSESKDPIIKKYFDIAASRNEYLEYKQKIFDKLDAERNNKLRKKIKTAARKELKEILKKYPKDYLRVLQDKPNLTDYQFDRVTMNKLVKLNCEFNNGNIAARDSVKKIIKSLVPANDKCVEMLTTEFLDPIKIKLIQLFDFNFQKMYSTKQSYENIYIKLT